MLAREPLFGLDYIEGADAPAVDRKYDVEHEI